MYGWGVLTLYCSSQAWLGYTHTVARVTWGMIRLLGALECAQCAPGPGSLSFPVDAAQEGGLSQTSLSPVDWGPENRQGAPQWAIGRAEQSGKAGALTPGRLQFLRSPILTSGHLSLRSPATGFFGPSVPHRLTRSCLRLIDRNRRRYMAGRMIGRRFPHRS